MTTYVVRDVLDLDEEAPDIALVSDVSLLPGDAGVLQYAVLKSVLTSPGSFLATADELKKKPPSYWLEQLESSTWAVVERGDRILGIAAAKPPRDGDTEYAEPGKACFIESVWLHPSMRAKGVGKHLLSYLIEEKRGVGVQDFYLWVLDDNAPAIGLYEHMQFKLTHRSSKWPETQYRLAFDSDVIDDHERACNEDDRMRDWTEFRVTYRLLSSRLTSVSAPTGYPEGAWPAQQFPGSRTPS
jgi:putative acetyltransferase